MDSPEQYKTPSATESLSLTRDDRASSTQRDHEHSTSDIELVPLVPVIDGSSQPQEGADGFSDKTSRRNPPADASHSASRQPNPRNSKFTSAANRLLLDTWVYETVAMSLSIACLAAIAMIVGYYNNKAVPQSVITLNTAVAVLSTAARSGLIFVVSAVVGQMKWCWIRKSERQLQHRQTMDDASRGPMGAMYMIALWTGGTLAAAGGILTVLLVAFSPFLQQLLEYPLRDAHTPSTDAWVPQNLDYNYIYNTSFEDDGYDGRVDDALDYAFAEQETLKPLDFEATCPVSRCAWHGVKSIGWCTKCEDVTAIATVYNCAVDDVVQDTDFAPCDVSLGSKDDARYLEGLLSRKEDPSNSTWSSRTVFFETQHIWPVSYGGMGYVYSNSSDDPGMIYDANSEKDQLLLYRNNTHFLGVPDPLLVFGEVVLGTNEPPLERGQDFLRVEEAKLCILSICERECTVEKEGCATSWTETSRNYGKVFKTRQLCDLGNFGTHEWSKACWRPGGNSDPVLERIDDKCQFADMNERAFCPVDSYWRVIQRRLKFEADEERRIEVLAKIDMDSAGDVYYDFDPYTNPRDRNLTLDMETVANALNTFGMDSTTNKATGYTIIPEAYVHVRWQWMIFPVALELATLTLFILVVIHSRREGVPIWKSSILAIIYHSVEELRDERSPPTERLSDMQSAAEATAVGLWKSDDGRHRMARRPR